MDKSEKLVMIHRLRELLKLINSERWADELEILADMTIPDVIKELETQIKVSA